MNLLAIIKWLGELSELSNLQRTHAKLSFKASIVVQRLQRETMLLLLPPLLPCSKFTRRLGMSESGFGFVLEMIFST